MDISSFFTTLPDGLQNYVALVIILCNLMTVFIRPPAAGSRWILPYRCISTLALNVGWARNHLQPGHPAKEASHNS
ncbi:hypothetical protein CO583_04495 [Parasaccharibacter sp. TMW2.1882]|uniref:Uncharacterized protein n=2 Tax=Acetobacteraceae TaxID=433 RepID=A0ABX4ZRD5_9PROT|nr:MULTISPECIES: hypothetical protein [Acetobacteraceae]MCL1563021.1 hypothetical protein [Parasaccharibacter sp. TMW 2.1886]MCQ0041519.1 hypothetical protein [Bombella sp.]MUG78878.1 hypothetical protein [Bombella sp. ESL0380]QGT74621.1 hypothetical protein GN304_01780 [Bombella sp. ESL0368]MBE1724165.1 hypothetical protein [Bombella apis]